MSAQSVDDDASTATMTSLDQTVSALGEIVLASEFYGMSAAKQLGLSVSDNHAVSYLMSRGPMTHRDLARALGLSPGSVTVLVDRLEARGLARRDVDPDDRRRLIISLIDPSTHIIEELRAWLVDVCEPLSAADRRHATRLLTELADRLRARSTMGKLGPSAT